MAHAATPATTSRTIGFKQISAGTKSFFTNTAMWSFVAFIVVLVSTVAYAIWLAIQTGYKHFDVANMVIVGIFVLVLVVALGLTGRWFKAVSNAQTASAWQGLLGLVLLLGLVFVLGLNWSDVQVIWATGWPALVLASGVIALVFLYSRRGR